MIVGFTIVDFRGHEKEAIEYIQKVCILEDALIAQNIVKAGAGINVFSEAVTLSDLQSQPFLATPIETIDGKIMIISVVNFKIELLYNGRVLELVPTEYTYINEEEVVQFKEYISQGLIKVIPNNGSAGDWILYTGFWNDDGIWIDSDYWRD